MSDVNQPPFGRVLPFPATAGARELKSSATELLDGLWTAYTHASQVFQREPTTRHWQNLVRAHACWGVAFRVEHFGGPG